MSDLSEQAEYEKQRAQRIDNQVADGFAMVALAKLIEKIPLVDREGEFSKPEHTQEYLDNHYRDVAISAYAYADAMMKARSDRKK